jgi:hypothetical protein
VHTTCDLAAAEQSDTEQGVPGARGALGRCRSQYAEYHRSGRRIASGRNQLLPPQNLRDAIVHVLAYTLAQ